MVDLLVYLFCFNGCFTEYTPFVKFVHPVGKRQDFQFRPHADNGWKANKLSSNCNKLSQPVCLHLLINWSLLKNTGRQRVVSIHQTELTRDSIIHHHFVQLLLLVGHARQIQTCSQKPQTHKNKKNDKTYTGLHFQVIMCHFFNSLAT